VLTCHPAAPCHVVQGLSACLQSSPGGELTVDCSLRGDLGRLRIPSPVPPRRVDGLWAHTCFEIFVGLRDQSAYYEFNRLCCINRWRKNVAYTDDIQTA